MNYYMNGNDAFRLKLWLRNEPKGLNENLENEIKGAVGDIVEKKENPAQVTNQENPAVSG